MNDFQTAFNAAQKLYTDMSKESFSREDLVHIFPQLKDKEQLIKEVLTDCVKNSLFVTEAFAKNGLDATEVIKWITEASVNASAQVKEPFKVGEWIAYKTYTGSPYKVINILDDGTYIIEDQFGEKSSFNTSYIRDFYHKWTIKDASPRDILVDMNSHPFMFKSIDKKNNHISAFCGMNDPHHLYPYESSYWATLSNSIKPASYEQREALFKAIEECGYEWDENSQKIVLVK